MGWPNTDPDALDREKPQHRVRITSPYHLSVTEVTRGRFRRRRYPMRLLDLCHVTLDDARKRSERAD
jgi:hypothetical protein